MILQPKDAADLIGRTHTDRTILVGGQAVAFWSGYFHVRPRIDALTRDIDFIGTRAEAVRAARDLAYRHELRIAGFDDPPPNTAVLLVEMKGYREPIRIDYLTGVIGPQTAAVARSAVTIAFAGHRLKVIHPIELLRSKIGNLHHLPAKRTPEGAEQARLAIEIVAAYLNQPGHSGRDLLRAIEAVGRFAASAPALDVRRKFRLDCLDAVPAAIREDPRLPKEFRDTRWPQIVRKANG